MRMPEAPAIITGSVFRLVPQFEYDDDGNKTSVPDGAKVALLAEDGATEVKLDQKQLQQIAPVLGDVVAWVVRFSFYSMGGGGLSIKFVDRVQPVHVEYLASTLDTVKA